jgi:hypothetical protein
MLRELPILPQDDRNERLTAVIGAGRKPPAVIFVLTEGSAMQMMAGPFRQSARNLACFINGKRPRLRKFAAKIGEPHLSAIPQYARLATWRNLTYKALKTNR